MLRELRDAITEYLSLIMLTYSLKQSKTKETGSWENLVLNAKSQVQKLNKMLLTRAHLLQLIVALRRTGLKSLLLLLLFIRPLQRDGRMAEDHEASEAGQLPRVWTRGRKETESRQRVSGAKSPSLDSAE